MRVAAYRAILRAQTSVLPQVHRLPLDETLDQLWQDLGRPDVERWLSSGEAEAQARYDRLFDVLDGATAAVFANKVPVRADAWRTIVDAVGDVVRPDDHAGIARVVADACGEYGRYQAPLYEIADALGVATDGGDVEPDGLPAIVQAARDAVAMVASQAEDLVSLRANRDAWHQHREALVVALEGDHDPFGDETLAVEVARALKKRRDSDAPRSAVEIAFDRDAQSALLASLEGVLPGVPHEELPSAVARLKTVMEGAIRDAEDLDRQRRELSEALDAVRAALPDGDRAEDLAEAVRVLIRQRDETADLAEVTLANLIDAQGELARLRESLQTSAATAPPAPIAVEALGVPAVGMGALLAVNAEIDLRTGEVREPVAGDPGDEQPPEPDIPAGPGRWGGAPNPSADELVDRRIQREEAVDQARAANLLDEVGALPEFVADRIEVSLGSLSEALVRVLDGVGARSVAAGLLKEHHMTRASQALGIWLYAHAKSVVDLAKPEAQREYRAQLTGRIQEDLKGASRRRAAPKGKATEQKEAA